jgi:3-deoxy-D-manno-octulosonate 8-phosphate phosphatase (KDO 8-P phosphatase)
MRGCVSVNAAPLDSAGDDVFRDICAVFLDVEGCLTDGSKYIDDQGRVVLRYSAIDGLGVWLLNKVGIKVAIVSASSHRSIALRAKEMGVMNCSLNVTDKAPVVVETTASWGVPLSSTCMMGDDLWDLKAMQVAGVSICPSSAQPEILRYADFRTVAPGGGGAVRELANRLLAAKGFFGDSLLDLLK